MKCVKYPKKNNLRSHKTKSDWVYLKMISDFQKIVLATICFNLGLIYLAFTQNLNAFDSLFIYSSIFIQYVFLNALFKKKKEVIHHLHLLMMIYIILGVLVTNKYLVLIVLSLLLLIQTLWILRDKCILSQFETSSKNGFGKRLSILSLFYSVFLSWKLGYSCPIK